MKNKHTSNINKCIGYMQSVYFYVGGKEKNKHYNKKTLHAQGRSLKAKVPVIGIVQKGGSIVAKVTTKTK